MAQKSCHFAPTSLSWMREVDETCTSINYEIEIITRSHILMFKSETQENLFFKFRVSLLLGCVLNYYLSPVGLYQCIYGRQKHYTSLLLTLLCYACAPQVSASNEPIASTLTAGKQIFSIKWYFEYSFLAVNVCMIRGDGVFEQFWTTLGDGTSFR